MLALAVGSVIAEQSFFDSAAAIFTKGGTHHGILLHKINPLLKGRALWNKYLTFPQTV